MGQRFVGHVYISLCYYVFVLHGDVWSGVLIIPSLRIKLMYNTGRSLSLPLDLFIVSIACTHWVSNIIIVQKLHTIAGLLL